MASLHTVALRWNHLNRLCLCLKDTIKQEIQLFWEIIIQFCGCFWEEKNISLYQEEFSDAFYQKRENF